MITRVNVVLFIWDWRGTLRDCVLSIFGILIRAFKCPHWWWSGYLVIFGESSLLKPQIIITYSVSTHTRLTVYTKWYTSYTWWLDRWWVYELQVSTLFIAILWFKVKSQKRGILILLQIGNIRFTSKKGLYSRHATRVDYNLKRVSSQFQLILTNLV